MRISDIVALAVGALALVSLASGGEERDAVAERYGYGVATARGPDRLTYLSRPYDKAMAARKIDYAHYPGR